MTDEANGELVLGGVDPTRYVGNLTFARVTKVAPYSNYWGIDVDSATLGTKSLIGHSQAIIDTVSIISHGSVILPSY